MGIFPPRALESTSCLLWQLSLLEGVLSAAPREWTKVNCSPATVPAVATPGVGAGLVSEGLLPQARLDVTAQGTMTSLCPSSCPEIIPHLHIPALAWGERGVGSSSDQSTCLQGNILEGEGGFVCGDSGTGSSSSLSFCVSAAVLSDLQDGGDVVLC